MSADNPLQPKGPNGKSIYPVALAFNVGPTTIELYAVNVEAVSPEEAHGLGDVAANELVRSIPRLLSVISVRVGFDEIYVKGVTKFWTSEST